VGLTDRNRINAPPLSGASNVAAHPPAQRRDGSDCRYLDRGDDKPAGVASPRLTTSEGVAAATANCPVVAARHKSTALGSDVLKVDPVRANFQHAAVKAVLEVEIIPERHLQALS